jgi:hypothetical protein
VILDPSSFTIADAIRLFLFLPPEAFKAKGAWERPSHDTGERRSAEGGMAPKGNFLWNLSKITQETE